MAAGASSTTPPLRRPRLAYLLQQQQDAVGLVTFNTKVQKNLPASSHPSHLKLMLHELEQTEPGRQDRRGRGFSASWPSRFAAAAWSCCFPTCS